MKPLILIVDDEPGVRASLMGVLKDEGYEVEAVPSGEACLERLTQSAGGGLTQLAEATLRIHPNGQVQVAALMPEFNAGAAELTETRNLFP